MGVKKILISLVAISFVAACGGGSGGGGLPTSRVEAIYKLMNRGMTAGLLPALQALLMQMNNPTGGCPFGTAANVDLTGLTGICAVDDTVTSGTWTLSGTVTCTHEPVDGSIRFTITQMDAALTLADCASTVTDVDTNGDGVNETTAVKLTGAADPFAFAATSTILAAFTDPPVVTLNGSADMTFAGFQLGGDITATATFTQGFNFDNMVITAGGEPTCDASTFSATESGQSGTCTIATTCGSCT